MSVLIKGMKMPTSCLYCRFSWGGDSTTYCTAQRDIDNYGRETLHHIKFTYNGYDEQQSWREDTCPLTEVPPHGRLIDMEEIGEASFNTLPTDMIAIYQRGWNDAISAIVNNARTIIEAEGEENDC